MGDSPSMAATRTEQGRSQVTPERWQEVKKVLAGALERTPEDRPVYLDQACTDPGLRREVESLITAHEQGKSVFMERPGGGTAELKMGTRLGPYEILGPLGSGGMGVVYKARDTKLGRLVALKFLRQGPVADAAARDQLLREARNASALNHPHIATIYDIREDSGHVYIAMELVDGRSLKELVQRDRLPIETVIRYGLQISSALGHAHERGVVHRDFKTANVVITADGQAKVLDFGLAKRLSTEELVEVTLSQRTEPGTIVGTLPYMAPETLRGEPADARTDLWALGAVIYEMVAGTPPFQGRTPYELSSAILQDAFKPLSPNVPQSLRAVIHRCLAKEPGHRYQRANEVRAALEAIGVDSATASALAPVARARWQWISISVGVGILLLLLVGGFALLRLKRAAPPAAAPGEWVQLTDFADSAVSPALSPDGRMLAFIRGGNTFIGNGQIYVKLLPNGEPVQLTHDHLTKMSPEFSPDGSSVAYTVPFDTWVVPALGGEPRLMLPNAEGLTWIDPGHLLFSEIKTGIHMAVVTATESRTETRDIYVPPRERGMAHRSALSPDHKWVLVAEMDNDGWLPCRVVPFDGSSAGTRVGPTGAGCTYAAWSPDGAWMYFSSDSGGRFHIWRQHFPDGTPEQVTSGPTEEEGIALAPDGRSLVTSSGLRESTLWVRDSRGERQISSEGYAEYPKFSPDGKKLYYLLRRHGVSGQFINGELWLVNLETNRSERLLPGFLMSGYDVSPDGKSVVFSAMDAESRSHLWLASLDLRSPPQQFPSSVDEDEPSWDAVGDVFFRAAEGRSNFLYRMKPDGSERVKALRDPILQLQAVSPDGSRAVVLSKAGTGREADADIIAFPLGGGAPATVCSIYCVPRWNASGNIFSFSANMMGGTKTVQVPVSPGKSLPSLPLAGIQTMDDMRNIKGAKVFDGSIVAGPKSGLSASLHQEVHRNLYKIPLQ
jgi:Tol biopolymer transport system component/tRNA A-37 threonylcarbamoyl transferase component Bud32